MVVDIYPAAEEKSPYEAKARADKIRYTDEISEYKNPQTNNVDPADAPINFN